MDLSLSWMVWQTVITGNRLGSWSFSSRCLSLVTGVLLSLRLYVASMKTAADLWPDLLGCVQSLLARSLPRRWVPSTPSKLLLSAALCGSVISDSKTFVCLEWVKKNSGHHLCFPSGPYDHHTYFHIYISGLPVQREKLNVCSLSHFKGRKHTKDSLVFH